MTDAAAAVDVFYQGEGMDQGAVGLGLRLHFDSTALMFTELENVLAAAGKPTVGPPEPDLLDFDNDPATDTFVNVLWFSLNGSWPGTADFVRLYTATFVVSAEQTSETTTIRFTASSISGGFKLRAEPALINVIDEPPIR